MEITLAPMLFMLLIGGVSGYFAGQVVKRASGMALSLIVIVVALIIMASAGTFDLNVEWINTNLASFLSALTAMGVVALVSSVPFVASFIAGIFIGYRKY